MKGFVGPETEFFLKDPETGKVFKGDMFEDGVNTFYASNSDDNVFAPFFAKLATAMDEAGITRDGPMHSEVAEGQLEVTRKYFALERADMAENVYRTVLKNTARLCGFEAELGAFPIDEGKAAIAEDGEADIHIPNASGMHMNTSILKLGKDGQYHGILRATPEIGRKENPTAVLSEDGARYIQGGLAHMGAMTVITNPDVGIDLRTADGQKRMMSHDRLGKNEAPGQVAMVMPYVGSADSETETHSGRNRTVPMNITLGASPKSDRVEFRQADPTENTPQGNRTNGATMGEKAAATIIAGFTGIMEGKSDVKTLVATYENLYTNKAAAEALPQLPKTARESYDAYVADGYLHTGEKATIHPARMTHILQRTRELAHI